jgi:hypothetical protein
MAAVFYWLSCRFRKLYPFSNTASPGFIYIVGAEQAMP